MATQTMIVRCKCSTAQVRAEVTDRGGFVANDANAWISAAQSRSVPVERLPGGYVRTAWFGCQGCGAAFKVETVKGRRTKHECDAKCLSSKGPVCECACGGRNHGASYA